MSRFEGGHTGNEREYDEIIVKLFNELYKPGLSRLEFNKDQLARICKDLGIIVKNIPDIIYTYRYRAELPRSITQKGNWAIIGKGKGKYTFVKLSRDLYVHIPTDLEIIPIPDATPGVVLKHVGVDEQSLLAKVRYNRLVDIFLGITAFHLQGHFRTFLEEIGQVEIDDLYVAVDKEGKEYVIPIGAKGPDPREKVGITHVADLINFGKQNFPELILRPVVIKEWQDGSIFMLLFNTPDNMEEIRTVSYKRYKPVPIKEKSQKH